MPGSENEQKSTGTLYLVATPIGNMEDITLRAIRILGEVDVVAAEDTRTARRLLRHHDIEPPRLVSLFEGNEAARSQELLVELAAGKSVAVVSEAGTPGVSDPGQRFVAAAVDANVKVEVIPGAVAAIVALTGSGLPSESFLFLGFPPRDRGARQQMFGNLRGQTATMLFHEAPDRVGATLQDLVAAFGGERRASVARELTKFYEEYIRGSLQELAERYADESPRGECCIVVKGGDPDAAEAPIDVEAAMRELLASGLGPKDAAARLVVKTGKPRRVLYQLALSLQREK